VADSLSSESTDSPDSTPSSPSSNSSSEMVSSSATLGAEALTTKESGADTIQEIEPFHANINTPTITQHFKNATETQLIELESGFLWGEDNGFIGEVLNSNQELRDTTDMALNAETLMVIPGSAIGDCPNQPGLHHSGYQDPQYNMARVEVVPNIANAFSKTALAFLNAPFPPPETIQ